MARTSSPLSILLALLSLSDADRYSEGQVLAQNMPKPRRLSFSAAEREPEGQILAQIHANMPEGGEVEDIIDVASLDFHHSFYHPACKDLGSASSQRSCAAWTLRLAELGQSLLDGISNNGGYSLADVGMLKNKGLSQSQAAKVCPYVNKMHWLFCHSSWDLDHPSYPETYTVVHDVVHKMEVICHGIQNAASLRPGISAVEQTAAWNRAGVLLKQGVEEFLKAIVFSLRNIEPKYLAWQGLAAFRLLGHVQSREYVRKDEWASANAQIEEQVSGLYEEQDLLDQDADEKQIAALDDEINKLYAKASTYALILTGAQQVADESNGFSPLRRLDMCQCACTPSTDPGWILDGSTDNCACTCNGQ
jgi:hypothetical protein